MTSLAHQLQRLAVPHTQAVFAEDKRRVSLLFDPKEAANFDREAVFAIGQGGLEELENVDAKFIDFEETLFNLSSQNWERSLQTKEVNKQLNETIREFLILLSPYFPLKSAHKALEWLIYRYHIHQYNKDDLLTCVLPYHEMKIYVRVLQLIKLDDPADKWNWLQAGAKSGIPLARGTLVNHCMKDPGFMAFILEIVPMFIKVHGEQSPQLRSVIALHMTAMLGALQHREQITEKMMSLIVPHLVRGFKARSLEYRAACYMILSQLVVQVQLKEELFVALLPVMSKRISSQLTQEALACLSLVFQTQKISTMPKKTFRHLCRIPGIILLLGRLTSQYDLDGLLKAWVQRLIPSAVKYGDSGGDISACSSGSDGGEDEIITGKPPYPTLLHGVLTEVTFCSERILRDVIQDILESLLSARQVIDNQLKLESWHALTNTLLTALENRHNRLFEKAVEEVMSLIKDDESSLVVLEEMMTLTNSPAKYQLVPDTSTSLLLGLKHHSSSIRSLTLSHVRRFINENQGGSTEFLEPLLLERLSDEKPDVVMATLRIQPYLQKIVKTDKLTEALLSIIKRTNNREHWYTVNRSVMELLCKVCGKEVTFDLLPYLMVLSKHPEALNAAKVIMTHAPGDLQHILKPIRAAWLETCEKERSSHLCSDLNLLLISGLVKYVQDLPPQQALHKVNHLISKGQSSNLYMFLVMCSLGDLVSKVKGKVRDTVMDNLLTVLDRKLMELRPKFKVPRTISSRMVEDMMPVWTDTLRDNTKHLLQTIVPWIACRLVDTLKDHNINDKKCAFITEHQRAAPVLRLLNMLMRHECGHSDKMWRNLVKRLVIDQLPLDTVLPIFHYIWTFAGISSAPMSVCADLHIGSFYLFGHLLDQLSEERCADIFSENSPTLACLVMSLCHPEDCIPSIVELLQKVKVICGTHLGLRKIIIKKLIGRPHVPQVVLKKLYKGLVEGATSCKVTQAELRYFIVWLSKPETPVQMKQQLMNLLNQVNPKLVYKCFIPIVSNIVKECSQRGVSMETGQMCLLKQMLERICELLQADVMGHPRCADVLFEALATTNRCVTAESPQDVALACVNSSLLLALTSLEFQQRLVSVLLDIGEKSTSSELSAKLRTCMIELRLRGRHVLHELDAKEGSEVTTVKGKKRSRTAHSSAPLNYARLSLLLEVIQARRKVKDRELLAAGLFSLLGRLLRDTHKETEFCKQMTLTCLHNICSLWRENSKPENPELLNIEDLVHCIRTSQSPQTQQQAVMVMTAIAPLYPEYILHHVMSIFTFMGSSMLQQDDAYSFQIITKTLDTIIPALIKACADKDFTDTDESTLIRDILRVFIDARHHIPKHRCTVLFRHLAERVGPQRHLYTMMVLQMESAVRTKDVPTTTDEVIDITEEGVSLIDKDVESLHTLCRQFDVSVQLHSITEVMTFLGKLCHHLLQQRGGSTIQSRKAKKSVVVPILVLHSLSPQQLRLIQYHTTRLVATILGADDFIAGIEAACSGGSMPSPLQEMFQTFVQQCLLLLTDVAKGHSIYGNTATSKFWRAALHKVYEVLDKVNVLLPKSVFLTVISSLLCHSSIIIRRKALDLLNNKMQLITIDNLSNREIAALLDIVPRLLDILQEAPPSPDVKNDYTTLIQMALYSLKLLCKLLGPLHPGKFTKLFPVCLDIVCGSEQPVPMVGSALLCLSELCASLMAQSLPYMPKFMPPLMILLKDVKRLQRTDLILVCTLTMLQKVVGSLPHFLSPYLLDILTCVCRISTLIDQTDNKKTQPAIRLKAVRHQLATAISARVLVPALIQTLDTLIQHNQLGLISLFEIVQEHVTSLEKEDLNAQHSVLVRFLCQSLDLRNAQIQLTDTELDATEHEAIEAVMKMVMKLSENSFRPMFYKLYDWACREESDSYKNRRLVFFRLAERLSDKLKSLFNLFIGHAVKAACDLLNANNTKNGDVDYYGTDSTAIKKTTLLLGYTISCLHKCFLHDTEGFVTKEMFASLLHPLVDQLENMIGGDSAYEQRINDHVMPCISQLALASRDDTSWKALNYQVLLKTRHVSPKVRFATLQVVEDLATKLGDEYMTLLPETVPFLAELMEDDSEEVEQKCQQVVTSLESSLGESLQQYF